MRYELNGKLTTTSEWDELIIGDEIISQWAEQFRNNGKKTTVRFYVSDNPINSETVVSDVWTGFYSGDVDAGHYPQWGSEWTGQYGVRENLKVGSHDLLDELGEYKGKYILLQVDTKE